MVQVAAAVVPHGGANGLRHLADLREQLLDREFLEFGMAFERLVEVGDISRVVLVVVDLHGLRVDVWLERVVRIWERKKSVRHRVDLLSGRFATGFFFPFRCGGTTGSFPAGIIISDANRGPVQDLPQYVG